MKGWQQNITVSFTAFAVHTIWPRPLSLNTHHESWWTHQEMILSICWGTVGTFELFSFSRLIRHGSSSGVADPPVSVWAPGTTNLGLHHRSETQFHIWQKQIKSFWFRWRAGRSAWPGTRPTTATARSWATCSSTRPPPRHGEREPTAASAQLSHRQLLVVFCRTQSTLFK